MRSLYFVPVIHDVSDMGSFSSAIETDSRALLGDNVWIQHKCTVSAFWDSIECFFDSLNVGGFKIYQDGLPADGRIGLQIIKQGVKDGSRNYIIIENMMNMGAVLVKTEDLGLLEQEHSYIKQMTQARTQREIEISIRRCKEAQERLLNQRDAYIARRIDDTLLKDETGVLFIGANHDIVTGLPVDIKIIPVKDATKLRRYHRIIIGALNKKLLKQTADEIIAPVRIDL